MTTVPRESEYWSNGRWLVCIKYDIDWKECKQKQTLTLYLSIDVLQQASMHFAFEIHKWHVLRKQTKLRLYIHRPH